MVRESNSLAVFLLLEVFLTVLCRGIVSSADNLNTFAYSPRPNTEAADWEDQIPEEVKSERLQRVQKLAAEHGSERSERYVGRVVEVLVEDVNPRNPNQVMGRTRQARQAYFDGDLEALRGKLVNVLITEARTWSLVGEIS